MTFPINAVNQRSFADDWSGEVFTCDIDRTYLMTRFSSLKGMARIPFEFAVDKNAIDGMTTLLKEVRRGPEARSRQTPIYFVSASPPQLRRVIERKMLLDGLECDGTTFKDWFGVVRSWRFERFSEQVGFKLTALLSRRDQLPSGARETVIGDDLEGDALAFCLYADVLAHRLGDDQLLEVLARHGVAADDAGAVAALQRRVGAHPRGAKRAYIRLERHEPEAFIDYAPRLVACRGPSQIGLSVWADGSISLDGAMAVVREVAERSARRGKQAPDFLELVRDCCRRGMLDRERGAEAAAALASARLIDPETAPGSDELPAVDERWAVRLASDDPFWTPPELR